MAHPCKAIVSDSLKAIEISGSENVDGSFTLVMIVVLIDLIH